MTSRSTGNQPTGTAVDQRRHNRATLAPPRSAYRPEETERLFRSRYVGLAVLVAMAGLAFDLPPLAALILVAVGLPAAVIAHRHTRRHGQPPWWMHLVDVLGALGFVIIYPKTFLPAAFLLIAVVGTAAAMHGTRTSLVMAATATTGLLGLNLIGDHEQGTLVVLGFAITSATIAWSVGELSATEGEVRQHLNTVVGNLDAVLWVRDPASRHFTFVNQRAAAMLDWPEDRWYEPGFWIEHVHPEDRTAADQAIKRSASLGVDQQITYRFRTGDGRWVHLQDRVTAVVDSTGRTVAIQGVTLDITERVAIDHRVNQYVDIVDRIDLALLILRLEEPTEPTAATSVPDTAHRSQIHPSLDHQEIVMVAANPAAERLIQRDLSPLLGHTLEEAFPALAGSRLRSRLAGVVNRGTPLRVDDLIVKPASGAQRVVALRAFPLPGRSVGISLQDVTDASIASEALRRQAMYDGLTGLPNRHLLDDRLKQLLHDSSRTNESVGLLVMDLDQFKEVNDALGHHVGDQLLRRIGQRLADIIDDALVARLGGDEFAVVLSGGVDERRALEVAERVRDLLAEPVLIDEVRLQSNASIGIALFPDHARDVATLIQRADVAMYVAKRTGSGVAIYSADQDRSSVERLTILSDLSSAVPDRQLQLRFQPFIDLHTGRPVRAEALLRWEHPTLGLLQPNQFIELAELSGAIQPITRWVVEEGLRSANAWAQAGHDLGLAVNLSVRNLYDPDLVGYLADALAEYEIEPGSLVLELTETELMDDPGLAREVFTRLRELGVSTSIDDFGTGYSSLAYLRDLPLQEIKIDKSFVTGMYRRSDEFTIVHSMIDLGHNLGLEVVAEGVEDSSDLTMLQRIGCDLAQGYLFSHPLAQADILTWLEEWPAPEPATPDTSSEPERHRIRGGTSPR